jgi:hypothetical protein
MSTFTLSAIIVATFFQHILGIVMSRSQKQMFRINTGGIIAAMADKHIFGNRAIVEFIGNAMSIGSWRGTHGNESITFCAKGTSPDPTAIGLVDFAPKALCERFSKLMTWNIKNRLTYYPSQRGDGLARSVCFSATAAMTITVGNIVRGMIGVHENLHFSAKPPNDSPRCGGNFIGCCNGNYTT